MEGGKKVSLHRFLAGSQRDLSDAGQKSRELTTPPESPNRGAAFSDNTKKTYQTHLRSYITFCEQSSIVPVPAMDVAVAKYAALLAPSST